MQSSLLFALQRGATVTAMGALQGVRVLDLTRVLAGPWATQLLADLGADVVKVERPVEGDDTRRWGPPYLDDPQSGGREAAFFLSCNRGKRSIEIDLTSTAGQAIVRDLACVSDVVVENFKVGSLAKFGLDAVSLRALNARLIYCSITGFGQDGPYAQRPGYDFVVQGMGGLMSLTGAPDHEAGGGPMKVGVALTDIMTGLYATSAILAALHERERTNIGRTIDLALLDVQVAALANQALSFLATGVNPERFGNAVPAIVPYEAFATADGHVIIAAGNDGQFHKLCHALERASLASDPRFVTNDARVQHRRDLIPLLGEALRNRSTATWLEVLEKAGVPVGPINTLSDVFRNDQVMARGLKLTLPHSTLGSVPSVACPIRFDGAPLRYSAGPPALGEHTAAVFEEWLGLRSVADSTGRP
jgi:crotonobetainyl-CoA:carnitine CoA-transferase CaiB-like acyl-CoA transferase